MLCLAFAVVLASGLPADTREAVGGAGLLVGGVLATLSCGLRATASAGRRRRAWLLLMTAAVVAVLGNVWVSATGADSSGSASGVSNASILAALILAIAGLESFPTTRLRGLERARVLLDGVVVGGAVLVIASVLVFPSVLASPEESAASRGLSLVFPVLDVVLATVALMLVLRGRRGDRPAFALLAAGFVLYAVADLTYAALAADGSFRLGTPVDLGWIAGYLLIALAAWYPAEDSGEQVTPRRPGSDAAGTVMVFGVLLVAALVQMAFGEGNELDRTQAGLWLVLVLAAGTRQTVLTVDNAALRRGLERRVDEQTADLRRLVRQTEVLLTSVGDGIYGVDDDGRVTFVNPSAVEALGWPAEELRGQRAHQTFHGPGPDGVPYPWHQCYITEAIHHGLVAAAEEDVYVRRDSSTFPVEITASPMMDEGDVRGAVVVFRDVTERQEVDRLKNEFLSVVSHELRTPLTSIRGSLGLLAGGALGDLPPRGERLAGIALESSERLTRLINDILDMERIESGSMPMEVTELDAADLLRDSAAELAGLAAATRVEIVVTEAAGRVLADADRVKQTVSNLVGNAVKFSEAGGQVRLRAAPEDGSVLFSVQDDGRGIPPEKLETVFERFQQVDSSDRRKKGGTGLGLAISRGIVQRLGGKIWAESTMGVGTTISFTLPAVRPVQGATPQTTPRPQPSESVVVVCDDDPAFVRTTEQMLLRRGFTPVGVTDGREAVRVAVARRPAAVLVDLLMPHTSGAEVVAELRRGERTADVPVVVVSGLGPEADQALAADVEGWLVKPVSEEQLYAAVRVALRGHRHYTSVLVVAEDDGLAGVLATLLAEHGLKVLRASTVEYAVILGRRAKPRVLVVDLRLPDGGAAEVVAGLRDAGMGDLAVVAYGAADVEPERRAGMRLGRTVFVTKAGAGPEDLTDVVLDLVGAMTDVWEGGDVARRTTLGSRAGAD